MKPDNYHPNQRALEINLRISVGLRHVSVTITHHAEVNLAWWLAWTSNPVVVRREAG
jgi:hypothetical protein